MVHALQKDLAGGSCWGPGNETVHVSTLWKKTLRSSQDSNLSLLVRCSYQLSHWSSGIGAKDRWYLSIGTFQISGWITQSVGLFYRLWIVSVTLALLTRTVGHSLIPYFLQNIVLRFIHSSYTWVAQWPLNLQPCSFLDYLLPSPTLFATNILLHSTTRIICISNSFMG